MRLNSGDSDNTIKKILETLKWSLDILRSCKNIYKKELVE